jgi:PhzF family phenazine biosynthesis protein
MTTLHLIDAFADGPFTGNPAGVTLLDGTPPPDSWCQAVAMEMNQAETAFLTRRGDGFGLRWFTPVAEVELCGHATLAAAHFLWDTGALAPEAVARFHTLSGVLTAVRDAEGWITLDFPAIPSTAEDAPPTVAAALGAPVQAVLRGAYDLLCVLEDAAAVRALTPDLGAIGHWDVRGVIATAPSDRAGVDFVSRCFFPALGVPEDPVTGSAHCALAPYWAAVFGRDILVGEQASRRGGQVRCEAAGDRVRLAGRAITTLRGELCQ